MDKIQLYYDNVSNEVFDANGRKYPIKDYNRSKQVNIGNKKVSISKLPIKPFIRNFDDVCVRYILCWHITYPCFAIDYFVYRKETNIKISLQEFKKQFYGKK